MHSLRPTRARRRSLTWSLLSADRESRFWTLLVVLAVAAVTVLGARRLAAVREDLDGTAIRQGHGTVTSVAYQESGVGPRPLQPSLLSIDHTPLQLSLLSTSALPPPPLYRGQRVRYRYRVGRGGRWYLVDIVPLPAAANALQ